MVSAFKVKQKYFSTYLVCIGKGHKRTSLPNTSCIFLQHPKLKPFLSQPSENLGGRKDSKKKKIIL